MTELTDAADAVSDLEDALGQGFEDIDRSSIAVISEPHDTEYVQPWDRRPEESGEMYDLFLQYRDQGLGRTIIDGFELYIESDIDSPKRVTKNNFYGYAKRYEWRVRADSWDAYSERQYQLARGIQIRNMAASHAEKIEEAIEGLTVPMTALQRRIATDDSFIDELAKTDARKLITMVNSASRTLPMLMAAERLARGMPTEIIGGTIEHEHTVVMERDQIGEVLDVLADAGILDERGNGLPIGEIIDANVVEVHSVPDEGDEGSDDAGDQP